MLAELIQYTFFQHALLGCVLSSVLCAMVGTYIVTRRLVFISGGITHASMGGVGIGMYAGWPPLLSAAVFAVLSACGVQWMSRRGDVREDSAIALFWTLGMSVGIICSFLTPGYTADLSSYLFGNILTIVPSDLIAMALLTLVTAVVFARYVSVIRAVAFDSEFARSRGLPVMAIEYAMMALIALTIVVCLRLVGIVLVISLLTVPQATANLFCRRFGAMIWVSMAFGVADSVGGLLLATWLGIPSGAAIIFVSIVVYALCRLARHIPLLRITHYALCIALLSSCSTKKNNAMSRFYHAFSAHYNTFYNGQVAFDEGVEVQERGHRDNYAELLPMHIVANKSTAGMGKGNFETAVTKCEKAIKKHSIKAKPIRRGNSRLSEKEKAYRKRLEFNPFLYRPWMMLAQTQFRTGDFIEAASTFGYINRLYSDQPAISSLSRAWLARCYVMMDWPYDAEDVIRKLERDTVGRQARKQLMVTKAGYYILTEQYDKAIPELKASIKFQRHKDQRARLHYLLAQLYQQQGDNAQAYKEWRRVCRVSPPYELEFNARIMMTEVMGAGRHKSMIARLKRMARSDKNKDYLDRIYHAIGNIYLSQADTLHCIYAWEAGIEKATQSGPAKAMLLLRLGQLYYEREQYIEAQKCYAQCVGILGKEHREYPEAEWRNGVLTELEPHLSAVKLQDSLQALAKAPKEVYMAAIDRVIDALKKKEKEEAKKKAQAELDSESGGGKGNNGAAGGRQPNTPQQPAGGAQAGGQKGAWYFYNPQAVTTGKQAFKRQWGNRPLADNWRWSEKPVGMNTDTDDGGVNYDDLSPEEKAAQDSIAAEQEAAEAARVADSLANDPHNREYYLKQIPFEPEQLEASHATLADGLYNSALIEQERMENYLLAMRTWHRLLTDYPDYQQRDNAFYHLFLANGRMGDVDAAAACRDTLAATCPESQYTRLLLNPRYEQNARRGKHIEDSLYADAYQAYQLEDYAQVERLYQLSTEDFPNGPHRGRLLFVRAMSWLYGGERDSFLVTMKELTSKYSKEEVALFAQDIVKGVEEGRLLYGRADAAGLWGRHILGSAGEGGEDLPDSLVADTLAPHLLIMAWPAHDLDDKQLLYEVARYNFTGFMVRSFDIEVITEGPIHQLRVKGFNSFDEVHAYVQQLFADQHMATLLDGIRMVQISEANLPLLGTRFSYDEYDEWFHLNLLPEGRQPSVALPDEPETPDFIDPDDYVPETREEDDEEATADDDFDWPW